MIRRMSRKNDKKSGLGDDFDVAAVLRAAEIKRKRNDVKAAKVANILEKKRMASLQRAQFCAYQEERLLFEQQRAKKTFATSSQ